MTAKPPEPFIDKCWGKTRPILQHNQVEVHHLEALKGGYCSEHKHVNGKWNRFYVVSGVIEVKEWMPRPKKCPSDIPYEWIDDTELTVGEHHDVPPGVFHQFKVIEDATIIEIYWVDLDPDDIDRRTEGGMEK